ncbi:MAG: drug/metabolite exporter YedA [Planctomycetes bacterium]|nr:drug/metabolite exporter YedA [Planctomycetota bacterium]
MPQAGASRAALTAAFATLYVVWGSTYLGMAIAIETIPPFLMAGARFLTAGGLLYLWLRMRGVRPPTPEQWRTSLAVGAMLLLCGNGLVVWAQQWVPSGVAALIIASTPLWMVCLPWLARRAPRPAPLALVGIAIGMAGVVLLGIGPLEVRSDPRYLVGVGAILLAALTWAGGSLWSRGRAQPAEPLMGTAAQMLCGGALLFFAALAIGDTRDFVFSAVSLRSALALVYLIVVGAIIGFGTYMYLLRNTTPAAASTYAFVNPLVAVALGRWLHDEPLNARIALAATLVVAAVVLVVLSGRRRSAPDPDAA